MNMDKFRSLIKYFQLIIVVSVSFVAIYTFEFYPKDEYLYNRELDLFRIIIPGYLFTLNLIILNYKLTILRKIIFSFFLLLVSYIVIFEASFLSWGLFVPIGAGVGGFIIKKLFYEQEANQSFILIGFIAGFLGLVVFYSTTSYVKTGVGFGLIIVIWQLAIGIKCIRSS